MRFAALCVLLTGLLAAAFPAGAMSSAFRNILRTHWTYRVYLRLCRANLAQPVPVCYPSAHGAAWDARHATLTRFELAVVTMRAEHTLADWDRQRRSTTRRRRSLHRLVKRLDVELRSEVGQLR